MFRAVPALAAAVFALVGGAAPASADGLPVVSLTLTVSHSDPDGSAAGMVVGTLTCSPDSGIHRDPEGACAELLGAGGDFQAADHEMDGACPMYYAPVTVRATGWYGSSLVRYSHSYGNSCFFALTASKVWSV